MDPNENQNANTPPTQDDTSDMGQTPTQTFNQSSPSSSKGPVIAIIIILLILIAAGVYVFKSRSVTPEQTNGLPPAPTPEEIQNAPDPTAEELNSQSNSDDINDIENDLVNTDLVDLDAEINNIEKELQEVLN